MKHLPADCFFQWLCLSGGEEVTYLPNDHEEVIRLMKGGGGGGGAAEEEEEEDVEGREE